MISKSDRIYRDQFAKKPNKTPRETANCYVIMMKDLQGKMRAKKQFTKTQNRYK